MNIVFWIGVILLLVLVWFCLSFIFKRIGGIGLRLWNKAQQEIHDDLKEENDNIENEKETEVYDE